MSADYQVHDDVAVITLNNPPVNGLGLATRTAAVAGLRQAADDPAVRAIVITGAGGGLGRFLVTGSVTFLTASPTGSEPEPEPPPAAGTPPVPGTLRARRPISSSA